MTSECIAGLVSVVVPVYNREHMVGKTLDSILCQSYQQVEVVAVNDGSTDNSLAVLMRYAEMHPGKVKVIDQGNAGQVKARNRGLSEAQGEFIAFLDSDDTWEADKLSLQIPLLKGNVGLVYSGINEVDPGGNVIRTILPEPGMRGDIYRYLLVSNRMTGGAVVVSRRALAAVGVFDESFRAAENWDLWIRIARHFEVDYVDRPLVNYLKHPGNMSQDNSRMTQGAWSVLQKHLPGIPDDDGLKASYQEAYARYYYGQGVSLFGQEKYREARSMFCQCWKYMPNYQDTLVRVVRTLIGKKANRLLSVIKRNIGSSQMPSSSS